MDQHYGLRRIKVRDMSLSGKPAKILYSPKDFESLRKCNCEIPKDFKITKRKIR